MYRGKERDYQATSSSKTSTSTYVNNNQNTIAVPNESGSLERVPEDEGPLSFSQLLGRETGEDDVPGRDFFEQANGEERRFGDGVGEGYSYTGELFVCLCGQFCSFGTAGIMQDRIGLFSNYTSSLR